MMYMIIGKTQHLEHKQLRRIKKPDVGHPCSTDCQVVLVCWKNLNVNWLVAMGQDFILFRSHSREKTIQIVVIH